MVYTPFPEATAKALSRAFQKKTGIKVVMVLEGTTVVFGRIRAERERPRADVWYGAGGMIPFMQAAEEGLLEPYTPAGMEDLPVQRGNLVLRDQNWHWCGMSIIALGFAYNPRLIPKDDVPTTWDELIDPRWKGKIEMWDPGVSGTAMLFLDSALLRHLNDGKTEEEGWEWLTRYWKNLRGYTVEGKPAFNVARGESWIGIHFEHQVLEFLEEQSGGDVAGGNDNIAWVLPDRSPIGVDPIALIKGAEHSENGKKFIDFVMSDEGQAIVNRFFFSIDPERPAPAGLGDLTMKDLEEKAMLLEPQWMADSYDRVRKRWQNEIETIPRDE